MQRLAMVEWRLRESAGELCPGKSAASGLKFDYIGAYGEEHRPLLRSMLGLTDVPHVAVVIPGSPAHLAGVQEGDALLAVNGRGIGELREAADDPELLADEVEVILEELAGNQDVELTVSRDGEERRIGFRPVMRCATRIVLKTRGGKQAFSDGRNIALSTGMIRFTANDDELALLAGHELAHVINRDGKAGSIRKRRRMEDAADALGAALAHCAGYDVSTSTEFWMRYHRKDWLRWFRAPTHRGAKSRAERLSTLADELTCPVALTE